MIMLLNVTVYKESIADLRILGNNLSIIDKLNFWGIVSKK